VSKLARFLCVPLIVAAGAAPAQVPVPDKPAAGEQQSLEQVLKMVRGDIEAQRNSALHALVELTEDEAKAFWPLKEAYDKELLAIGKRRLAAVQDYVEVQSALTAAKAQELGERFHQLDLERLALRKKYFDRIAKEVSPVAAVQFMQLQRQFETMGDLKVATMTPLAAK
jgi:hypothetical protein